MRGLDVALDKARELASLHERSKMKEIPSPAAILTYAKEGVDLLKQTHVLCICPLLESDG